jgi:hypothetical protein
MTPKELVVREGTQALRAAHAYSKVVDTLVQRAESLASMAELPDELLAHATFLRSNIFIASA